MRRVLLVFGVISWALAPGPARCESGEAVNASAAFNRAQSRISSAATGPFSFDPLELDPAVRMRRIDELEPEPLRDVSACGKVDLRDRFGKVRDQGGSDWCYGYAMADFLSFYTGRKISAFDLALRTFGQYKTERFEQLRTTARKEDVSILEFAGGRTYQAFSIAKREGVCEEGKVRSSDFSVGEFAGHSNPGIDEIISEVEQWNANGGVSVVGPEVACRAGDHARAIFEDLSLPEIFAALGEARPGLDAFGWLSHFSCEGKRVPLPRDLAYSMVYVPKDQVGKKRGDRLLPYLDELIGSGHPAALQLDVSRITRSGIGNSVHVALIVGREVRDGKCQYLLRNSWGKSCTSYARPCEEGNVWITEDDIRSAGTYVGGMK